MTFGTAVIIVNEKFTVKGHDKERRGASEDNSNMQKKFKELGFDVKPHFNKNASDIRTVFQEGKYR